MDIDNEIIETIAEILARSKNNVVVTGAGISTEAGIPDFRGEGGIYQTLGEDRVVRILNIDFFKRNPRDFYDFYRKYLMFPSVEPSLSHRVLADMEKKGYIKAIVTQNIDNLHQRAGSRRVIAVHGNAERYICTNPRCSKTYDAEYIKSLDDVVPGCAVCGSVLKPDVVLFGEPIQNYTFARDTILNADVLIVIGSSLTVYPIAGFVSEFARTGRDLIIINKGRTSMDHLASVKLDTKQTGLVLKEINNLLSVKFKGGSFGE
ncbi:MAG: NAD-dependent protein deacylase [Thermacetogeniaceae bacterium]